MQATRSTPLVALVFGLALAGCASTGGSQRATLVENSAGCEYGRVASVEAVRDDDRRLSTGAIIGGVVGGVLGHQIGSGTGQTAATVAGTVGGALLGDRLERNQTERRVYLVRVHLSRGIDQQFRLDEVGNLRNGDRVCVDGNRLTKVS